MSGESSIEIMMGSTRSDHARFKILSRLGGSKIMGSGKTKTGSGKPQPHHPCAGLPLHAAKSYHEFITYSNTRAVPDHRRKGNSSS